MLEKLKILLGIPNSDTSQDSRLSFILKNLEEEFPLFKQEIRREKFFRKKFQNSCIPISFPFLQKILKINGKEISEKDYGILDNGEVFIKNLSLIPNDNVIIVEFESGFEKIPSKFLSDILLLAQIEFSKESGKNIVSEQLGPRAVRYEDSSSGNNAWNLAKNENSARNRLKSACIPAHLRAF